MILPYACRVIIQPARKACSISAESLLNLSGILAQFRRFGCAISVAYAVLDGYPVDRLMHDIALALMAVQTQTTEILSEFPTKAAKEPASPQTATEAEEIPLF